MMSEMFPRTKIGNLSVSRMIMGTNNIVGGSHRTKARDTHIQEINNNKEAVAEIVQTYLSYGVDTIIGGISGKDYMLDGVRLAEERTGQKVHIVQLTNIDVTDSDEARPCMWRWKNWSIRARKKSSALRTISI